MPHVNIVLLCVLFLNNVVCENDFINKNNQDKVLASNNLNPQTINKSKIKENEEKPSLPIELTTHSAVSKNKIASEEKAVSSLEALNIEISTTVRSIVNSAPGVQSENETIIKSPFGNQKEAFSKDNVIFDNITLPTETQLLDFKLEHPKPIGLLTLGSGQALDVRETITFNSDLSQSDYFYDMQSNADGQHVPQRIVHAKGTAAWGYFEVTNDVSNYTYADVFNGIGKKTTVLGRLSVGASERGVSDVGRDLKGFVMKFYTEEGNLDFLNLHTPVFAFNDPLDFNPFARVISRNPKTNLPDPTALIDLLSLRPQSLPSVLYLTSDRGIPDGWRYADFFAIHTYELNNKHGERWYARFNWKTEMGLRNLTLLQIFAIQGITPDYYIRDLYTAIAGEKYPSWRLEMDVLSLKDIQSVNYNPFDVTRLWKKGTYSTVTIGRLTLNEISDNQFRDQEQAAFSPSNLVPGIPGPVDALFKGRRFAYRDAQNYRISLNFNKIGVNKPFYTKTYVRDGHPPVHDNERDAPVYYPNSFNGPLPLVDEKRSYEKLQILESNAADLQEATNFYEEFAPDDASKDRMALNMASILSFVTEPVRTRMNKLLYLVSPDLYRRLLAAEIIFRSLLVAAQASSVTS